MIAKYRLPNGIPVFVVETDAAPVVSIQAWVSRGSVYGSVYESEKVAGISHFLEHALFKGTKRRKVGEIALEIESRGGEVNAFTSYEETAYYTTLASRYFEQGLDVIADAIQNPAFDAEEMLREREVILEEIKRAHDSPGKMVATNLWGTCFAGTPFGRPVLGFQETVSKIDHRVLRDYFKKNYHARTVSLFIVGNVDKDEAFAAAKRKLSRMPKGPDNKLPNTFKMAQSNSVRVVSIARDIQQCQVQIGVPTKSILDPSTPILDLLCSAVGQGESSRLYQRVVKEKRLALDVSMGLAATGRCGLAALGIVASPDKLEAAITECMDVLWETARDGLEEGDIDRVKNSLESDVIGGKETVDGYARRLGYYYIQFGDPGYEKKYLDDIMGVDLDDTTTALRELLVKRPVVSMAHPKSFTVDKKSIAARLAKRPAVKPGPRATHEPEKTEKLGATLISKRVTHLPIVSMKFVFAGGSKEETPEQYGLTNLFQRLWTSASRSYGSRELSHILESLGADISSFAGRNTHGLDVEFISKQWSVIRPILGELLTEPTFPEDDFETERAILIKEIQSERDTPGQICNQNFQSAMYGADHPYGRSHLGALKAVEKLTTADLKKFFREYVHRGHLVVSSVGSFPNTDWASELEPLLKMLPPSGRVDKKLPSPPVPTKPRVLTARKEPLFQSHVLVGFPGARFDQPERLALKVLSSCLAGQGGRLFLELRDKQSLAYTVAPMNSDGPIPGVFAFYIGCSPEKLERALRGIRIEIEKVLEKPLPAIELKRAKDYWIGRFELDLQRYGSQASLFGLDEYYLDEYYGLGHRHGLDLPGRMKEVTAAEVQAAARKFLDLKVPTFSIVHNQDLTEEQVLKAWSSSSPESAVRTGPAPARPRTRRAEA
jgi:zinc protease